MLIGRAVAIVKSTGAHKMGYFPHQAVIQPCFF